MQLNPGDLDVIVVLPGEAAPPEDVGSVLDDEYRALFFEAIDAATAPTTTAAQQQEQLQVEQQHPRGKRSVRQ